MIGSVSLSLSSFLLVVFELLCLSLSFSLSEGIKASVLDTRRSQSRRRVSLPSANLSPHHRSAIPTTTTNTTTTHHLLMMHFIPSTSLSVLALVLFVLSVLAHAQEHRHHRVKGDQLDVPVRAGYRIEGNDDDGFLEDGIIVKTKGTGYIDARYRSRYQTQQQPTQSQAQDFAPSQSQSSLYYTRFMKPSTSEIIYGHRGSF